MSKSQVKGHTNAAKGEVKEVGGKVAGDKSMAAKRKPSTEISTAIPRRQRNERFNDTIEK